MRWLLLFTMAAACSASHGRSTPVPEAPGPELEPPDAGRPPSASVIDCADPELWRAPAEPAFARTSLECVAFHEPLHTLRLEHQQEWEPLSSCWRVLEEDRSGTEPGTILYPSSVDTGYVNLRWTVRSVTLEARARLADGRVVATTVDWQPYEGTSAGIRTDDLDPARLLRLGSALYRTAIVTESTVAADSVTLRVGARVVDDDAGQRLELVRLPETLDAGGGEVLASAALPRGDGAVHLEVHRSGRAEIVAAQGTHVMIAHLDNLSEDVAFDTLTLSAPAQGLLAIDGAFVVRHEGDLHGYRYDGGRVALPELGGEAAQLEDGVRLVDGTFFRLFMRDGEVQRSDPIALDPAIGPLVGVFDRGRLFVGRDGVARPPHPGVSSVSVEEAFGGDTIVAASEPFLVVGDGEGDEVYRLDPSFEGCD